MHRSTTRGLLLLAALVGTVFLIRPVVARALAPDDRDPCDPRSLGQTHGPILTVYALEAGEISNLCFGPHDSDLDRAWQSLAAITTPQERASIAAFAIYEGDYAAYTQRINTESTVFVIAVNRPTAQAHPQTLRHTMAHEFAHVITAQESNVWNGEQVATSNCIGDDNLYGCAGRNNYLATWTYQFWPSNEIESLDRSYHDPAEAARRCLADPGFVGPYAATNPGEDFAEAFAAFVLSIPVPASAQSRVRFMSSNVEIVAIRDRIHAAGLSAPDLVIGHCG